MDESRTRNLYVEAAPGCFAAYAELIGRQGSNAALGPAHMLSADIYPAQHPGVPGRQSSQSVWVHLVGLCLMLEFGFDGIASARAKARLAAPDATFEWLEPPVSRGALTVLDIPLNGTVDEQMESVRRWAQTVWAAWARHHEPIRGRAVELARLESEGRTAHP